MKDLWKFLTVYYSILFLVVSGAATLSLAQVLPLDATRAAAAERRLQREVNVLARVQPDDERGDVHHLLADTGTWRE